MPAKGMVGEGEVKEEQKSVNSIKKLAPWELYIALDQKGSPGLFQILLINVSRCLLEDIKSDLCGTCLKH